MRHRGRTKVLAVVALAILVLFTLTRPGGTSDFEASGDPLPLPVARQLSELTADQFEGVLLGLHGTPVIVNVWASWCAPCRTETPLLERTWEAHGDEVMILGVASKDVPVRSLAFMREFDVGYPNVVRP